MTTAPASASQLPNRLEVHDPGALARAREVLNACGDFRAMGEAVKAAVARNAAWRGEQCINLLAPEAPTSPAVRALLSSEIGTRAAEGHIGPVNRWFAGTRHIDEVEALCVELLKRYFRCNYADHRLCASMIGNAVVYTALSSPGDVVMTAAQPVGGHSSNRLDGPAGAMGRKIVDIPMDPRELVVDVDAFRTVAEAVRPKLVALGLSMSLFPQPVAAMKQILAPWQGRFFFDAAHQLGLIGGGQFQDPLKEGADIMTGSAGKTFSGPQSGIILWDDPEITRAVTTAVFPVWAATHQVNRVAALALATAEAIAYGEAFMRQIVRNAKALAQALEERQIPMLGSHKGFTETHQAIGDVRKLGRGLEVAQKLEQANIIVNKNLIPADRPENWDFPGGIRIGTIEVTRLGMKEAEMTAIAELIARVIVRRESPDTVKKDALALRAGFQTLYYCFETGLPA
ncbi:MAG TPA: aminotransferase class I/II-fold pyridoxal phosphate-dependent enzyme [Alphaproteobacteria bacterium]|nr:aminotransferase class I/II-fold pyridoxal phosphate-dependent enzyme [Alphaproteobacteria bacterium]